MAKKYSEILIESKEILKDESKWLKSGSFFDAHVFNNVDPSYTPLKDTEVNCMCGMGAALAVNWKDFTYTKEGIKEVLYTTQYRDFTNWVNRRVHVYSREKFNSFYNFNDSIDTTHEDLIKMLDNLIKEAIEEEETGGYI